jgi:alpha-glucosidase (family GH31 glycosyl hydrolase)
MKSIVAAGLVASSSALAAKVTLVPWCDNSFRVMINPTAAQHAALLRDAAGAAWAPVSDNPPGGDPGEPFAALDGAACTPGAPIALQPTPFSAINGNLEVTLDAASGALQFWRKDLAPSTSAPLFQATAAPFAKSATSGFLTAGLSLAANATDERIFGLGQGNWTSYDSPGCASGGPERIVPLERNGQTVGLQQQKFHVTIPFAYSTAGYGFLWNMPGAGRVDVGHAGVGGMEWTAEAATGLDFWVTGPPPGAPTLSSGATKAVAMAEVYKSYADATGHAPPLREDAMIFWQSRNRYKSSDIVLAVCDRYKALDLPVGVIVVDYKNQDFDGDFAPNPDCYPSVKALADGVKEKLNATMTFSFWPEAKAQSAEYGLLNRSGCLINSDLGGNAIDPTTKACRDLVRPLARYLLVLSLSSTT